MKLLKKSKNSRTPFWNTVNPGHYLGFNSNLLERDPKSNLNFIFLNVTLWYVLFSILGPIETFDAYVCHNPDTDYQFVLDMISAMEKPPYNLRFCTDWRDLVPGGAYATATAELIENR